MKLIQGMKAVKDLMIKAQDLRGKIAVHSADLTFETPVYENQKEQVSEWLQAHSDVLKEILRLRVAIQRTNLATPVTIELGGKQVTKNIAEWIHRRRDLASYEKEAWSKLTDKNLKEGVAKNTAGVEVDIKLRRYYDPKERDAKLDLFRSEPSIIDGVLEVVNAVTDLIES